MSERYFVLRRSPRDYKPRNIRRPPGVERATILAPPPWRCISISLEPTHAGHNSSTLFEYAVVAASALTPEQIARYEQEADYRSNRS